MYDIHANNQNESMPWFLAADRLNYIILVGPQDGLYRSCFNTLVRSQQKEGAVY